MLYLQSSLKVIFEDKLYVHWILLQISQHNGPVIYKSSVDIDKAIV